MQITKMDRIYNEKFERIPQTKDALTNDKAKSARIFKEYRDLVTNDEFYITLRKQWRERENNTV